MHALARHAALQQRRFHRIDHGGRTTDESRIDLVGRDQRIEEGARLVAVEPAVEQRDLLRLARQHVIQREAVEVAVLQVFQRLGKDDAVHRAVAVDQRESAVRLGGQRGLDQRQDGRDAAAGSKRDIVARALGGQRHVETAVGRQHVQRLADADAVVQVIGEHAGVHALDGHAQLAVRVVVLDRAADRIRAPQLALPGLARRHAQRQELPLREAVRVAQVVRHIEAQRDGIGRLAADFGNAQRMELRRHGGRAGQYGLK